MLNDLTIITADPISTRESEKFEIIRSPDEIEHVSQRCSFDSLMNIIECSKPHVITVIVNNMYGKTAILFLSYLMSKKYKPFLYKLMFKHTFLQARIIAIRFTLL